ncbi:MAG: T9SS type A sorting domain-containing protein, partial [Bacteroidetes bacterium]|nr:T9SS type A sorting domain-containing protein [Bacteroidota bacterium]
VALTSQATITINLTNVNEAPVIANQTFTVAENSVNGTSVGTVVASDPDAGQILTYSIFSGNTSGAFAINTTTGVLTVANSAVLDFETNPTFTLVVKVQDNGTVALTSQATITINLTNVNEAPVIANQTFTVAENSVNGTSVGTVVASDPDAGQTLLFSIIAGNVDNAFTINGLSGALTVANSNALDFSVNPVFTIEIRVKDNGYGNLYTDAWVTVNILQASNQNPVISNQAFLTDENSIAGSSVGFVIASDPDPGQTLSYSILSGNNDGAFSIDASTGELTVANSSALNFEVNPTFSLTVKVEDNATISLSNQAIITIVLMDINETPVIVNQEFSIAENAPYGTVIGTVSASDPDEGQQLTYSILMGNTNNAFAIQPATGELSVINSNMLDFETNNTFTLIVNVSDNGADSLSSQAGVIIHITDLNESPVITNQTFQVNENASNGTNVGTVVATDPDAGQSLSFSIESGNTDNAFSIDQNTGTLSVNNSNALNYLVNPSFVLIVRATDNGTGNLFADAEVSIVVLQSLNQQPIITDQSFTITENEVNGTSIGIVEASDPDPGQSLTYSILSGNTGSAFEINPTTGELTVSNSSQLDFESHPVFHLEIEVQDNGTGNLSNQAVIQVNLLDVNEYPMISEQLFSVEENSAAGTLVGTVQASDPDQGQHLTYSILAGNTFDAFSIDSNTGSITIVNSQAIDFELIPSFELVVQVKDDGQGQLSNFASITIQVINLNEPPAIFDKVYYVEENSPTGTYVGNIMAVDPDQGQTITYSIVSGNLGNAFVINSHTGDIRVANSAMLDYETHPTFNMIVQAQDDGPGTLSARAKVTISLLNVNETPFFADQAFDLSSDSPMGAFVGKLYAADPDSGQRLSYAITSGNGGSYFSINPSRGILTLADTGILNQPGPISVSFTVTVTDNGNPGLSTTAEITVHVSEGTMSKIVYIDPENSDDKLENGTEQHPFNSWFDFTFTDGYTYLQKRGTIASNSNSIIIDHRKNITIDAYGSGHIPVIYTSLPVSMLDLYYSENSIVRNVEFTSDGSAKSCISLLDNDSTSRSVIDQCHLQGALIGINATLPGAALDLSSTTIDNMLLDGIFATEFSRISVNNCSISNINQGWSSNPVSQANCIGLISENGIVEISHNILDHSSTGNGSCVTMIGKGIHGTITQNTITGSGLDDNNGIRINSQTGEVLISYNSVGRCQTGINAVVRRSSIYYNLFKNNNTALDIQKNSSAVISNNTFVGSSEYSVRSRANSSASSINNIFYQNTVGSKVYNFEGSFVSDYNLYNIETPEFLNGTSQLSIWKASTSQDSNSVVGDPVFANYDGGDFRLLEGSKAINKGLNNGQIVDFYGNAVPRFGTADIGFYESDINPDDLQKPVNPQDSTMDIAVTVYPNPTSDKVFIDMENLNERPATIMIVDEIGNTILSTHNDGEKTVMIDFMNRSKGTYFAVVSCDQMTITKKIIVL